MFVIVNRSRMLVVHHARQDAGSSRPGQALRGSSELHGWGDSNLYMRRRGEALTWSTEHRAAPSRNHLPLELTQADSTLAFSVIDPEDPSTSQVQAAPTPGQRVSSASAELTGPVTLKELRQHCQMRTATLCSVFNELSSSGVVRRDERGYQLQDPASTPPITLSIASP